MAGAGPLLTCVQMSVLPASEGKEAQAEATSSRELRMSSILGPSMGCSATLLQYVVEAGQNICNKYFRTEIYILVECGRTNEWCCK